VTSVLRNRAFARLLAAHVVSQVGSGVTMLALPLIAAVTLGASPLQVGLLAAAETIPLLALGLLAGVWADRVRRRPLMVAADQGRFALLLLIPLAAWQGWLSYWLLVGVMLAVGSLSVLFDIASQSYTATLLRGEDLLRGNSLLHTSYSIGEILGPGLAGLLIGLVRAPMAILADALSFLIGGMLLASIRAPEPPVARSARSIRADLVEGIREVARTPVLRALGISTGVWNLFDNARLAMLVLFMTQDLGLGAAAVGVVYSVSSVGWLIGTLLPGPAARRFGLGRAILVGAAAVAPGGVLIALAGGSPLRAAVMVGAGFFIEGLAGSVYDVNQYSLRQAITPLRLQGRVAAVLRVLIRGTVPLGALLGGALASAIGLRGTMWVALLGPPIALAVVWFSPVRGLREMPEREEDEALPAGRL
jgi:MFS family permease